VSGSLQEVNKHSINVGVPRDGAVPHQVRVGSCATCMHPNAESTGVIGVRKKALLTFWAKRCSRRQYATK